MRVMMMAVLLLAAMPVAAQNWVKVASALSSTVYLDPGTIRVSGHLRRVWEIQDLKQRDPDGVMSRRGLWEYDCKEERSRILSFSSHAEPMAQGRTLFSGPGSAQWDYIPPNTINEGTFKLVCSVGQ